MTIYHGIHQDVVPFLETYDLLMTDPPYGIGRDGKPRSTSSHGGHKGYEFMGWDSKPPTHEEISALILSCRDFVIWGANYFCQSIPPGPGWMLWDKGQRLDQADGELAASSRNGPLRVYTLNRVAIAQDGAVHPTQKPIQLMLWCLKFFPDAMMILDPFMGSGTTLRAAKDLGRKAIGIEIEERYCEIAATRMSQEVMNLGV